MNPTPERAAFRRVRKPCTWCRRTVETLAKVECPLCRGCRAKRRNLLKGRDSMRGLKAARAWASDAGVDL